MKKKYYTLYDNKTDSIVASGFLEEVAKQLGTTKRCASSIISLAKKQKRSKYSVVIEYINKSSD